MTKKKGTMSIEGIKPPKKIPLKTTLFGEQDECDLGGMPPYIVNSLRESGLTLASSMVLETNVFHARLMHQGAKKEERGVVSSYERVIEEVEKDTLVRWVAHAHAHSSITPPPSRSSEAPPPSPNEKPLPPEMQKQIMELKRISNEFHSIIDNNSVATPCLREELFSLSCDRDEKGGGGGESITLDPAQEAFLLHLYKSLRQSDNLRVTLRDYLVQLSHTAHKLREELLFLLAPHSEQVRNLVNWKCVIGEETTIVGTYYGVLWVYSSSSCVGGGVYLGGEITALRKIDSTRFLVVVDTQLVLVFGVSHNNNNKKSQHTTLSLLGEIKRMHKVIILDALCVDDLVILLLKEYNSEKEYGPYYIQLVDIVYYCNTSNKTTNTGVSLQYITMKSEYEVGRGGGGGSGVSTQTYTTPLLSVRGGKDTNNNNRFHLSGKDLFDIVTGRGRKRFLFAPPALCFELKLKKDSREIKEATLGFHIVDSNENRHTVSNSVVFDE